jgi:hypothetical protein
LHGGWEELRPICAPSGQAGSTGASFAAPTGTIVTIDVMTISR